jgi:hypothetical protein
MVACLGKLLEIGCGVWLLGSQAGIESVFGQEGRVSPSLYFFFLFFFSFFLLYLRPISYSLFPVYLFMILIIFFFLPALLGRSSLSEGEHREKWRARRGGIGTDRGYTPLHPQTLE